MKFIPLIVLFIMFVINITFFIDEYSIKYPNKKISKKWRDFCKSYGEENEMD